MREIQIQQAYHRCLGGEMETKTKHGRIDLYVRETRTIYEFKTFGSYKHALGQLLAYRECTNADRLVAVLFNTPYHRFDIGECVMIQDLMNSYGIEVEFISKHKEGI